ncbi:MAG: metallophosphoesterase-domain-containing protein, partial [Rhodobacteraceae bacterium]
ELETINLAVWRAESKMENTYNFRGIHARDSDLEWLSKICRNSSKPLLIFSHIPLSGRSQIGNIFFENNEELSKYARTAEN